MGRLLESQSARPVNCDLSLGVAPKRCPHCGQFHLRPGYCQALDELNADRYPKFHSSEAIKKAKIEREKRDLQERNVRDRVRDKSGVETLNTPIDNNPSTYHDLKKGDVRDNDAQSEEIIPDGVGPVEGGHVRDNIADNAYGVCEDCHKTFHKSRSDARYCSDACRKRAKRKSA